MITQITHLVAWYNDVFKHTPMYLEMANTVEGSPWHREANVAVHTDMVFEEYVEATLTSPTQNPSADILGGFSAIFHDVGKPSAKQVKFRADRGQYNAFGGHEQVSARMFEDYAAQFLTTHLSANDITMICWMIEHHLPWSVSKKDKREQLMMTAKIIDTNVFLRFLMSDQKGRIADDSNKVVEAQLWCDQFLKESQDIQLPRWVDDNKVMYVPVGASGAGKSTLLSTIREMHTNQHVYVYSLDLIRQQLYGDDYNKAWQQSVEDNTFKNKAWKHFMTVMQLGKVIYVDNTNLTKKRRAQYITEARKRGFKIVGIHVVSNLQTVLDRQLTRTDKSVPFTAVSQQFNSVQIPSIGEVDELWSISGSATLKS